MMNPRYSLHTSDKTSPRGFKWIWFLRIAEIVVSLIVLALAARNVAALASINCSVPGKMGWNLACAVLSLFALVYLILSSGISRAFRVLPWWIFIQLGLDALFFIFWIAAAGTSHLNCQDLCSACDAWGGTVYLDSLYCTCYSSYDVIYKKRNLSPNPNPGLSAGLQKRRSRYSSAGRATGTLVAREALDAILVVLFFITTCATAWWMWQNRRAGDNAAAATTTTNTNPESGVQQVPVEMKQDTPYSGGPAPQYTTVAPQQGNYPPVNPANDQYPQQQQGYPQQQQPQGYPQQQQQQPYPQQQPQGYTQQQQQPFPQQQQQQQQYPEQAPQGQGYYGGQQQRDITPPPQAHQHDIPNYPTPTPEMQAEHAPGR